MAFSIGHPLKRVDGFSGMLGNPPSPRATPLSLLVMDIVLGPTQFVLPTVPRHGLGIQVLELQNPGMDWKKLEEHLLQPHCSGQ